jgi:hypothetical protein
VDHLRCRRGSNRHVNRALDDAHLAIALGDLELRDAGLGNQVDQGFQFSQVHESDSLGVHAAGLACFERVLQRVSVARRPQTGDHADRQFRQVGMVAKRFAAVDVAQVNFNEWDGHGGERVADGHAGVGVGGRVDDDEVDTGRASGLDPVDQNAPSWLDWNDSSRAPALDGLFQQAPVDVGESRRAIYTWFAGAQQIQIWSMQYPDEHCASLRGANFALN